MALTVFAGPFSTADILYSSMIAHWDGSVIFLRAVMLSTANMMASTASGAVPAATLLPICMQFTAPRGANHIDELVWSTSGLPYFSVRAARYSATVGGSMGLEIFRRIITRWPPLGGGAKTRLKVSTTRPPFRFSRL